MTGIYLSRICLRDFRTFGNFNIDIPPAPGLTILTGTNGLGKSNFFDGIEWALTGKVRRFSHYIEKKKLAEHEYLTRTGALPDSHLVQLLFSDGTQVERSRASTTPMDEIIQQLAQTDNSTIQELDTYLAFTHFLGQSSEQRFTSREAQEQWRALRGPSGIDRLESVREGIKNRAITIAFSRRKTDEESLIVGIELKIAEWEGLQNRYERLKQAMHATGALTPGEVEQRTNTLEIDLFAVLKEIAPAIDGEASAQRLTRLAAQTTRALQRLAERVATIEGLGDLIDHFATASLNARMDNNLLVRSREDVNKALVVTADLASKGEAARANLAAQNSAIRSLEQDITVLEAARSDLSRQQDIAAQVIFAEVECSSFLKEIKRRRTAMTEAEMRVRLHAEAVAEVARVSAIVDKAHSLVESHTRLIELDRIVTQDKFALAAAQMSSLTAKQLLESSVEVRNSLDESLKRAITAHGDAERQGNAISAAVVAIASHIGHDDTNCPVCCTKFEAGQLKFLADEAAKFTNDGLVKLAAEIEQLRLESASLAMKIVMLQVIVNAPSQLERTWMTNRDIASKARTALAVELGVEVTAALDTASGTWAQSAACDLAVARARQDELAAPAAAAAVLRLALMEEIDALIAQQGQVFANLSVSAP
jgi:DNA repair exonuclease SbcCD ATPase subunit